MSGVRLAVIGLGAMGSRIAARFLDAGHELVVWNRTAAKTEPFKARGAAVAGTPRAAASQADVTVTMLTDADALRAVVEGPDGIAAATPPVLIEMSTVGPSAVHWLSGALPTGTLLIDAPVLGSLAEVESGSLTIFVGGPDSPAREWISFLSALGTPIHIGPLGSGAAAKLVANSTLFGSIAVLGEALALAEALGIEPDKRWEVLAATPIGAQAERRRSALESEAFPPRFALPLARKDADLVVDAAAHAEVELRVAPAARSWLVDAERHGHEGEDYSAVLSEITAPARKRRHPQR
jgi:3-hydroxyisobutyrate dehydrogenase-like beta-hydroxyacid dehydrogenase